MHRHLGIGALFFSIFCMAASCRTPETAKRDMLRDARTRCERGDGQACFHAGALAAEEPGGASRAVPLHARGCALKELASCDALWASKAPDRAEVLGEGCNAGDLLSCARVAEDFAQDPSRVADAKALREQTCRMAAVVKADTPARDLYAAAEGCSGLARMYAKGEGTKVDTVLATKLDVLATTLRTEALARFDRKRPMAPKPGPKGVTESEKDRVQRLNDAMASTREALLLSIDAAAKAQASESAAPPAIPVSPTEPVFWPTTMAAGSPAKCQKCIEGCGDMKKCAGTDDFSGGRCGALKGTDKFEGCVAECTAKADACAKACGECSAAAPVADAPTGGDDTARCRETGDRVSCAASGAALEKTDPNAAVELYAAGCAKKAEACANLVSLGESLFKRREGPRAVQVLDKACELKSGVACTRLAMELEEGERGVPQDLAKAARLFDKACELGVVRACIGLAAMIDDGRGTAKNPARAKTVRARIEALDKYTPRPAPPAAQTAADEDACRKSRDAARCASAGAAMQDVDAVKAEELFRIGCMANKATCGLWSFAIDRFRKDDVGRGTRILEQGCQEGSALACLVFADVSRFGYRAVPRADGRVLEIAQRACELGDPNGCRAAASRVRAGIGIAKSATRADELREKAFKADEEAEKTRREGYEKWLERAAGERAREPFAQELERRQAELRAMVERSRGRAKAGDAPTEKSAPPEDADASALREGAIRRMAKALFLSTPATK